MNKSSIFYFCIIFFMCTVTVSQSKEKLILASGEWAPYLSKSLPQYGAASHIITEAFKAVGIDIDYHFYPWKRTYELTKKGDYAATPVWVYTDERAKDFYYSDIVIYENEYLFHLKSKKLIWNKLEDLKGLVIGATLHTVYLPLEKAQNEGIIKIDRAGNYDALYKRLIKKRIDAIPQVSAVGNYYLRTTLNKSQREKITYSKTILRKRKYSLIFSKKFPNSGHYLNEFKKGLKIIKNNGTYNKIISNMNRGWYDKPLK